jgi:hypothetical protein
MTHYGAYPPTPRPQAASPINGDPAWGFSAVTSPVMTRSRTVALATAAFVGTAMAAHAGPCTSLIAETERSIGRLASGPASGPTATQSLRAQLHHQPTPQSVERAVSTAHADAQVALDRARKTDTEGDVAACTKAIDEAKFIYGLK